MHPWQDLRDLRRIILELVENDRPDLRLLVGAERTPEDTGVDINDVVQALLGVRYRPD
jgi:hypothetical protein